MRKQLFYCGTQELDWILSNCKRCVRGGDYDYYTNRYPCELRQTLFEANWKGGVTEEEAGVIGYDPGAYVWMCNGYEATEEWKAEMALSVMDGQQTDLSAINGQLTDGNAPPDGE